MPGEAFEVKRGGFDGHERVVVAGHIREARRQRELVPGPTLGLGSLAQVRKRRRDLGICLSRQEARQFREVSKVRVAPVRVGIVVMRSRGRFVRPRERLQENPEVADAVRHHADVVEARSERHHAVAAHAVVARLQPVNAAVTRRSRDRPAGLAGERAETHAAGHGRRGTARTAARCPLEVPWVPRDRRVEAGERRGHRLAENDGTRLPQAFDHRGVLAGVAVRPQLRAATRR